ncbi:DUF4307 domain-containing protein [Microbacterium sp. W1N]|uniref:DUF4307 domain-containing protein n=1 Tax=Microbacterium festucae TaxID=2977531 RepID=UPI0021C08864|nr:DUF4307 domain-containing protein [Microbacterium festucae]MCT9820543.1 DUF4307 domain-containing protein [Microbacterium festucae]
MSSPTTPMTSPTAQQRLDDRYGRTRRRRLPWVVFIAVVVGLVGWYGWSTITTSMDTLDTDATGYEVIEGQRSVVVNFQTTGRADVPIACALEAQDVEHGVVGWRIVQYEPAPATTRSFSETIPTTAEATTGLVTSCWIP